MRTPQFTLPKWDVITFNFGLHDGADTNASYIKGLTSITDELVATAQITGGERPAQLVYFQTTIPGGAHTVPGEPISPSDKRVVELNQLAASIMAARNVTVVNLYATMEQCGAACSGCKPHCPPSGYQYLTDKAIVPAIKKALELPAIM